jgi:hypothetical protein
MSLPKFVDVFKFWLYNNYGHFVWSTYPFLLASGATVHKYLAGRNSRNIIALEKNETFAYSTILL